MIPLFRLYRHREKLNPGVRTFLIFERKLTNISCYTYYTNRHTPSDHHGPGEWWWYATAVHWWGSQSANDNNVASRPKLNFSFKAIALCSKGWHFWKGGFFTDNTGLKIFVFKNAMIFAFTTFVTNTPLYGKIASKVWKIYFQIYHLIFCMLQAAKYLIYDYFYFLILLFFLP